MNLKQARKEAWEFYKLWKKVHSYSPALKSQVLITVKGWNHIVEGTKDRRRNIGDSYRRMLLLPYARMVIEHCTEVSEVRKTKYGVFYALEKRLLVKSGDSETFTLVRVIIIETEDGNKKLLSVMD